MDSCGWEFRRVKDGIAEAICSNAIDGANRRGGDGKEYVFGFFASGLKYKFYDNDPQRNLPGYKIGVFLSVNSHFVDRGSGRSKSYDNNQQKSEREELNDGILNDFLGHLCDLCFSL